MSKTYVETTYNHGTLPSAEDFNKLNKRTKNAFELFAKALAEAFGNNRVVDSGDIGFDKVYYYDQSEGTYTDWTFESNQDQTPYFPDVSVNTADFVYLGFEETYDAIRLMLGSPASATVSPAVGYYNGSSWTSVVSLSDTTSGFTQDGTLRWATSSMADWSKDDLNTILSLSTLEDADRYWVRISTGNNNAYGLKAAHLDWGTKRELKVEASNPAAMTVDIYPGVAIVANKVVSLDAKATRAIAAPASDSRITIVQLSDEAVVSIKNGTSAAAPAPPRADADNIKLADVLVAAGASTITNSDITDHRRFTEIAENKNEPFLYFDDGDATPDVGDGYNFKTNNTAVTTITDFDGGEDGRTGYLVFGDGNTWVDFTQSNMHGNAGAAWNPAQYDSMRFVRDDAGNWYCDISDNTA